MKKKLILPVVWLLLGLLLLTGCGKSEAPTDGGGSDAPTVSEDAGGSGEGTVLFGLDDTVSCEGLCEMSGLYAEVLDEEAMAEGWYYYYTDTDESPARVINWELSDGNYTTVEVLFTVKNTSEEPQTFGDKLTARMLYRENAAAQTVCFDGTVFQQNPGQIEESGEMIMWSTKPTEIAAGESANVSFRFDIPKDVYEKIYAAAVGEDTEITESCEFGFGTGTTYVIDLAETLIPASRYA